MARTLAVSSVLLLLTAAPTAFAQRPEVVDFRQDAFFDDSQEPYFNAHMLGDSHATVVGGRFLNSLRTYDTASASVSGGWVNSLDMADDSSAEVFPGAFINTYIYLSENAVVNIYGGRMPDRYLTAENNSIAHLYVKSYEYTPGIGEGGDGRFTGVWLDGKPFTLDLDLPETFSHVRVHVIPEPAASALLLGLTLIACRRRSREQRHFVIHR